jgi:hypothetical protein
MTISQRDVIGVLSMSLEQAAAELGRRVFEATALLDQLQDAGKIGGSGHYARQDLARAARELIRDRWVK